MQLSLRVFGLFGLLCLMPSLSWAWTPLWVNGYCLKSGRSCGGTIGNAGGADACCDPVSKDVATCVKTDPCVGTHQQRWDAASLPLAWSLNTNGMAGKAGFLGLTEEGLEAEIKRSWDVWSKPGCTSFQHKYTGLTKDPPDYFDGKITLFFASQAEWAALGASGVLAFSVRRASDQGRMTDGDVLVTPLPGSSSWGINPVDATQYDLAMVLAHEIGHSIGFGHTPDSKDLMYFAIRSTGPAFAELGKDERDAVCATYPASNECQDTAACGPCRTCQEQTCSPSNPATPTLCKACGADDECGDKGKCVDTDGGGRCVQPCGSDLCCPDGYRCNKIANVDYCIPMISRCAALTCTSDDVCGRNGVCRDGNCTSKEPFGTAACARPCEASQDCGEGLTCHTFPGGTKRCLNHCLSEQFCPTGYSCRRVPDGNAFCIPHSLFLCPCQQESDCPKGQVCKNKSCQDASTGKEGALCNDAVPCGEGLRCIDISGGRCFRDCLKTPCPTGFTCQSYSINIKFCVGPETSEIGETCDSINTRCKAGLACAQHSDSQTSGICIQTCTNSVTCSNGDVCQVAPGLAKHCGCSSDNDCATRGMTCKDFGRGYRLCACEKPPCQANLCGNLVCDRKFGEDCNSCPGDCICGLKEACSEGACVEETKCASTATDPRCKHGCGCDTLAVSAMPFPLLLLLFGLFLVRRKTT